jgi:hypothetical protein
MIADHITKDVRMALKKNVFTADLNSFFDSLVTYNHWHFQMKSQLEKAKANTEKLFQKFVDKGWSNEFVSGAALGIIDIFHKGEWVIRAPIGGRTIKGQEAIAMVDETERRFNSLLLVSLFERFETFLKAIYGKMLYQLRHEITIRDRKQFHRSNQNCAKSQGTALYYSQ